MKLLLTLLLAVFSLSTVAQTLTDSTCTKYFEITDRLQKGDTLSREVWQNFLQDKAIKVYLKDQRVGDSYLEAYRKTMQVVILLITRQKLLRFTKIYLLNGVIWRSCMMMRPTTRRTN